MTLQDLVHIVTDLKRELREIRQGIVRRAVEGAGHCPLVHEHSVLGGPPTSGSVVWTYTIDSSTQDVTIDWDDDNADVESAFETAFSGIGLDVNVTGGPWPSVAVYVQFQSKNDVEWPPALDTNSLDAGAPLLRRNSPM